ncbi:MAG: NAD-dependent epimerase/dehydratase family protein [Gemmatimonadales bacterium]
MRILVIGGTNFIGPHVVTQLHRQGHEVTVYHRGVHEPDLPSAVRHIHSSRAAIPILHFPSALSNPAPDVVLHMFPVGADDTRAAIARFIGVTQRIVAVSSGDVYRAYGRLLNTESGPPEPMPLQEDAPLRETHFPYRQAAAGPMDWTYHYDKILAERALLESRLPATVLRLPAVYGPGDPHHRLRPYVRRMQDLRPVILIDALQARWRWTHGYVEDIARAITAAVVDPRATEKVYNLGEASTPTMAERIDQIGRLMDWRGQLVSLSTERLPRHLQTPFYARQDLVMDSRRIRVELDYTEVVSDEEALRRTIEYEHRSEVVPGDPGAQEYAAEDQAVQRGDT